MSGTLVFDLETHDADLLWEMEPEQFVRLIGYKWWGSEEVRITTDLDELRDAMSVAKGVVGHNIHAFDLPATFGTKSDIPLQLTDAGRVFDTWTHAILVNPIPNSYTNHKGSARKPPKGGWKPEHMMPWFSLNEQAHQLGVPGKAHDLREMAIEFADKSLRIKEEKVKDGLGKIPVDHPPYVEYLKADVHASEAVARELLKRGPLDAYAKRSQRVAARMAIISGNGFRVDDKRAQARVDHHAAVRKKHMDRLEAEYDFPTEGKAPWSTNEGKAAILKALADVGVTETSKPHWPRTEKGALQLGGEVLTSLTKGTAAEELGAALAELKGQRSLAQLALDSQHPDGFAHPKITMLQRSGRASTTEPGLTIWTARGPGAEEKAYFVPDVPDEALAEFDYSNADARFVAAVSGDWKYAQRFEPGADGHLINAWAAWGKELVGDERDENGDPIGVTKEYRQKAKPLGHGWSYGGRANTLSLQAGVPLEDAETFVNGMDKEYFQIVRWQNAVRKYARQRGYVMNEWGRKLWVEKGREFTQAPALLGQNGTLEIVSDSLLRMPIPVLRRIKGFIHDALVFSLPRANFEEWKARIVELMETEFKPANGGQKIAFPVSSGPAGDNWYEAGH